MLKIHWGEQEMILCPFHLEETPSCLVLGQKDRFRCLSCAADGTLDELRAKIRANNLEGV